MKKVSIIIPYNKDRGYLGQAIASAKKQNYPNIEVIESYSNNTLGYNVNRGIESATGDYIKILAEDDLLFADSINNLLEGIQGYDFVCGNALNTVSHGKDFTYYGKAPTFKSMVVRNEIHGGTPLYKKELFKEFGGWDESLTTAEEYDWHLKLLSEGKTCNYIDKSVCIYRIHNEGKGSLMYDDPKRKEYIEEIKMRYI